MQGGLNQFIFLSLFSRLLISCTVFFLIGIFSPAIWGKDAPYLHQIWRAEDGLPSSMIRAVVQSRSGYLWLGADDGLVRFDGMRFSEMEPRTLPDRSDRWLVALTETRDGSIWASSIHGGLCRIKDGGITRYTTKEGLLHNYVLSLCEDRQGNLWIGTAGGLNRWRDGQFQSYTNQPGLIVEAVRAILEDRAGGLWIGTAAGLSLWKNEKFTAYTTENGLVSNPVMSLLEDRRGDLWIGTSRGLTHWAEGKATHYRVQEGLAHNTVRALLEDAEGNRWIGSQGGLQLFREGKFVDVQLREETLLDFEGISFVYALRQDREGNIWVGSNLGLSRLRPQKFQVYAQAEGLAHNMATLVYAGRENAVWIGTYGGGLCRRSGEGRDWLTLNTAQGLSSDFVLALHEDRLGALWIGTDGGGLNCWQNGKITRFSVAGELTANTMRVIHEDREGNLWIGSNAGAFRFRDGNFLKEESIPRSTIRAILEDREGNLWFGTKNGLAKWKGGLRKIYKQADGLPSEFVATVFQDAHGTIWTATDRGGIHRLNPDGKFSVSPGGFAEKVMHIVEDERGHFWLGAQNGIFAVNRKSLCAAMDDPSAHVEFAFYGRKDGMRLSQCNGIGQPAGIKTENGEIWFPTRHGAVAFSPAELSRNAVPPPVVIEAVKVDGKNMKPPFSTRFPPGRGQVEIRYTALSFSAPERVRFQYKLGGADAPWEEAGARREAHYAGLAPGHYQFTVRACNNDGVWNQTGATLAFSLAPYFYQSPAFYALALGLLASAGFGLHRFRLREVKKHEAELAILVEKRTAHLQELVKSMESFNYSIAHDLRAPIRAIRGLTRALVEDYQPALDKTGSDYAARIERSVDRMDRLIQDLLTYGQISHKEIPLERVEMAEALTKTLDVLRDDIAAKNAVVEIKKPLPAVLANATVLEQILLNFLTNALKFVENGAAPRLEIWAEEKNARVRVFVQDHGIGIHPEYHGKIFRIFERLHTEKHYPGTGIGLAIVHRGIERMGGKVGVTSAPGRGSCFWLELPKPDMAPRR